MTYSSGIAENWKVPRKREESTIYSDCVEDQWESSMSKMAFCQAWSSEFDSWEPHGEIPSNYLLTHTLCRERAYTQKHAYTYTQNQPINIQCKSNDWLSLVIVLAMKWGGFGFVIHSANLTYECNWGNQGGGDVCEDMGYGKNFVSVASLTVLMLGKIGS